MNERAATTSRPTQAVILAGGRGTRLAPLTNTVPKPMIRFHGKPFLEYLIEMLREQGFRRVLLLLGYLPDVVRDYFGNGSRWGMAIDYAVSDVDCETGLRLKLAVDSIDPISLLLYCDNYWPMDFAAMCQQFTRLGADAQIAAYRNSDGYTKNNLCVDPHGVVLAYDKDRKQPGLSGVDIGYVLMKRSVIESLPDGNISFEREAYGRLVEQGKLAAYCTDHRYYSVGSHERLPFTDAFLARRPAVFLDRDGVLNTRMPRATYVCKWSQWEWLPGSLEALRLLKVAGYRVFVITNQPGIARGALTVADLDHIHGRMTEQAKAASGDITAIYSCQHNWDDGCACRKPRPGLLFQAQREHCLDLSRIHFIGDDERDAQAAQKAGCPWALVSNECTLLDLTRDLVLGKSLEYARTITVPALPRAA